MQENISDLERLKGALDAMLGNANLFDVLNIIWAVDALQSQRISQATQIIKFCPAEAMTSDPLSPYYAHKWRIEAIANRAIRKCRSTHLIIRHKKYDWSSFATFLTLSNLAHRIEGEEYNEIKHDIHVFDEVHRSTQRQFEWQRGFASLAQIYRYAFLFGGELCRKHIEETHGYTFNDLSLFCFCVRKLSQSSPIISRNINLQEVFLISTAQRAIVKRLLVPPNDDRNLSFSENFTYSQSLLRQFPLVPVRNSFDFQVPLPELLFARATSNIFYDFVGAAGGIRNEIGSRFEEYAITLMRRMLLSCRLMPEFHYTYQKNQVASPDIFCFMNDEFPDLVFECKSVRMNFDAKFSLDPLSAAASGYHEIAKGVFQIWKYVARRRALQFNAPKSRSGTIGILLTLDSWLTMSARKPNIIASAYKMAAQDATIDRRDDVPILFCAIDELEALLHESGDVGFFKTIIEAAYNKKYDGWLLSRVHAHLFNNVLNDRPFPFEQDVAGLLPWWKTMRDIEATA